ncbi:DoxX family protein [Chenggangzhangella methanolivorans]|uniref:DoxX family protein n=1 Tax=Chenggangzhangella methanolivorans TaxID=1437009 RepID=A0A9E6R804_9HYPH|nr:DoxX family protein [Chenggangzhangella methanolivorans]QZN99902.1 DoxX family protein [Chenggangzhangella methanolivorans]
MTASPPPPAGRSSREAWAGRALSGLAILFLLADGAMKLVPLQPVTDTMQALGWPTDPALLRTLGVIQIAATLLYAYPPSSVFGAVLLTGYLGGAIATHVRVGSPLFTHVLFGVYVGAVMWGGLWIRSPALRDVLYGKR